VGYQARIGATLLAIFIVLATVFFHNFWALPSEEQQAQMVQFMKNLAILGGLLLIIANGPGPWSVDQALSGTARNDRV
jgi:putative oxidoreductase